jgi:hypothetical protein
MKMSPILVFAKSFTTVFSCSYRCELHLPADITHRSDCGNICSLILVGDDMALLVGLDTSSIEFQRLCVRTPANRPNDAVITSDFLRIKFAACLYKQV